ncbi:hypothetical protein SKAU_G00173460 [Synaphobranchus kaupii]|uniref:Uncharacterized protein n=1 Tax=Synaphobranchus kaupii TaxID=118154 RepID=A0A9Q1FL10_SYNKA|nr:hypothetical protein SKAU_G00173460 [Synaphobranchus kaupii]
MSNPTPTQAAPEKGAVTNPCTCFTTFSRQLVQEAVHCGTLLPTHPVALPAALAYALVVGAAHQACILLFYAAHQDGVKSIRLITGGMNGSMLGCWESRHHMGWAAGVARGLPPFPEFRW